MGKNNILNLLSISICIWRKFSKLKEMRGLKSVIKVTHWKKKIENRTFLKNQYIFIIGIKLEFSLFAVSSIMNFICISQKQFQEISVRHEALPYVIYIWYSVSGYIQGNATETLYDLILVRRWMNYWMIHTSTGK